MLHFLAHSGLFARPVQAWLLRAAGAIPVYRAQDVPGPAERNTETFRAVTAALGRGEAIGIFPEGVSDAARRVQPVKTGAARMALQAEDAHDFALGVRIVPVGIALEHRRAFRSRVLLSFGPPLLAQSFRDAYRRDPVDAVRRLTEDLEQALEALVVHVEQEDLEDLVARVERVYRDRLEDRVPYRGSRFVRQQELSREIARAAAWAREHEPLLLWRVRRLLEEYERALGKAGLSSRELDFKTPSPSTSTARLVTIGVLGFPLALWGVVWNIAPFKLTGYLADRKAQDDTKQHWYQASYGTAIYLLYYPLLLGLAALVLGRLGAALFGASLFPAGLFARWYGRRLARERAGLRFAVLSSTRRYYVDDLRRLRWEVLIEMDAAVERFMTREVRAMGEEQS